MLKYGSILLVGFLFLPAIPDLYIVDNLPFIIFLISVAGFALNVNNVILMLLCLELQLLSISMFILNSSCGDIARMLFSVVDKLDDITGQNFALFIVAIAGSESALALGILVAYYRLRGSISISAQH